MAQSLVRLSGLAGILAGLAWFLGYAGFTKLLLPAIGQPGGHVVLGLAPDATSAYGMGYVVWALSSAGLLSAGWVTLGYALWSERYASAPQLVCEVRG